MHTPYKENTTYDITLPERLPYEANATMKQKDYLWGLGIRDQAILDSLGKWQASAMIDQPKKQQTASAGVVIIALILAIVAIVVLFRIFA